MKTPLTLAASLVLALVGQASAASPGWSHSGSMYILTTPEGADLPASASVEGVPLLVRLHRDFFDFSQAKARGEDLRFSSSTDESLPYQIEEWDAAKGIASIWVRMPSIKGKSRQEIKLHWGKADAVSESNGKAVFNESNGYLSVWHMSASNPDEKSALGGMELGRRLVENHKVPICLINGAVGGTRIDQHQRNAADPEDMTTIYGRLLWRVRQAKLTHGIRGVLWHQGENDQGADGPTGGFGWETYRHSFIELAAAWKQDYPNIQHYYVFQIWPRSCAMGINGSDNRLREVQRNLPKAFSNLSLMSTLGIDPPGGCHFPAAGYAEFARLLCPLVERDHYGKMSTASITPPNLQRASYASDKKDEIVLEFDQPVKWDNALASQFYLDGEKGKVASGSVSGNTVRLKLTTPSTAQKLTYLDSSSWSQDRLLRGENGIAALTFCEVPLLPQQP